MNSSAMPISERGSRDFGPWLQVSRKPNRYQSRKSQVADQTKKTQPSPNSGSRFAVFQHGDVDLEVSPTGRDSKAVAASESDDRIIPHPQMKRIQTLLRKDQVDSLSSTSGAQTSTLSEPISSLNRDCDSEHIADTQAQRVSDPLPQGQLETNGPNWYAQSLPQIHSGFSFGPTDKKSKGKKPISPGSAGSRRNSLNTRTLPWPSSHDGSNRSARPPLSPAWASSPFKRSRHSFSHGNPRCIDDLEVSTVASGVLTDCDDGMPCQNSDVNASLMSLTPTATHPQMMLVFQMDSSLQKPDRRSVDSSVAGME